MSGPSRLLLYITPAQIPLARALCERLGASIIAAGSPDKGRSAGVAAELHTAPCDDLRAALLACDCNAAIILAPCPLGTDSDGSDVAALLAARNRKLPVIALEPIPTSSIDLASCGWDSLPDPLTPDDLLIPAPLTLRFPATLAHTLEAFGRVRALHLAAVGPATRGTLSSRLLFASAVALELIGEIDTVDAAFVDAVGNPAIHLLPEDRLSETHGSMNILQRASGGRSASIFISDQAAHSSLTLQLTGDSGILHIDQSETHWTYRWSRPGSPEEADTQQHEPTPYEQELLLAALAPKVETATNIESATLVAQTCTLSARTGESESVSTLARILESARGG